MPVWQFVRLMVQVEETVEKRPKSGAAALAEAWGAIWTEVDETLTRLGKTDTEAFANLMMDQEVVLEAVTPAQARAAGVELAKVVASMRARLASGGPEADDLKFEIAELESVLKAFPKP